MFIRSTGEPVLAQVVGHSEHGDAYRRITYERDGKTVLHGRASIRRLSLLLGTSCILQGTFLKGNGFPKICLRLRRRQNHHPRVLPKAFQESGEPVQEFKVKWIRTKKPYTEPVKE